MLRPHFRAQRARASLPHAQARSHAQRALTHAGRRARSRSCCHSAHALAACHTRTRPCSPRTRPPRAISCWQVAMLAVDEACAPDDAAKCCPTVAGTVLRCDQDRASRLAYAPKQGIPLLKLRSRAGHTIDTAIAHHPQITVFFSIRHPLTHYMQSHGRDGPRHRTNLTRTLVLPFPSPRRARLSLVLPHALESKAEQSSVPLRNEKTVLSRARLP